MSINSITSNPIILNDLSQALNIAPQSQTVLLKNFYESTGNQTTTSSNSSVTLWTHEFNDLDVTKKYIVRFNGSWYIPSAGGVAGTNEVFLNDITGVLQVLNVGVSTTDFHIFFGANFTSFQPTVANDTISITITASSGSVNFNTDDYFSVSIDEIQN